MNDERLSRLRLPQLEPNRAWRVKEFLNNELQAYKPGSHVTFFVERSLPALPSIRWRDATYPAYVVDVAQSDEYFEETAKLMVSQHEEYVLNHNERAL